MKHMRGRGVVSHRGRDRGGAAAGAVAVRLLADRVGLTGGLSTALAAAASPRYTTAGGSWSMWR